MRRLILLLGVMFASASVWHAIAAPPAGAKPKRVKPPAFDDRTRGAFFEDARSALVGERPDYGKGGSVAASPSTPGPAATDDPSPAGGGYAWSKIISRETIEDEIKTIGKALDATVTTPQRYAAGDYKLGNQQFSVLAVLFAVAGEYDTDVRWKKQAPAIREVFASTALGSRVGSIQAFNQAKTAKQTLTDLVAGGNVQLKDAEVKPAWSKVAHRPPLMQRLEVAHKERILPWTANAGDVKKHAAEIVHEAELVAALADVIAREGFEYADDSTYLESAKQLKQSAIDTAAAARTNNADGARKAVGDMTKACAACHDGFRS